MRAYFFGNFMLSSIQQGIQAAHAATEMSVRYLDVLNDDDDYATNLYRDWAHMHKTMVLYNGGDQTTLEELEEFFLKMYQSHMGGSDKALPWAVWREDNSISYSIGSIGIIVPEYVSVLSSQLRNSTLSKECCGYNEDVFIWRDASDTLIEQEVSEFEKQLAAKLCTFRHAI